MIYDGAMYATLQDFVSALERAGELKRVSAEVSPRLEVSEIADRQSKLPCARRSDSAHRFDPVHGDRGGHAILFERVEGCDFPLLINGWGSYRRMEMALGVSEMNGGLEAIAGRIASLVKPQPPRSLGEAWSKVREFLPLLRVPPKRVKRGVCQEVVKLAARGEVDLTRLPLIKCWPLDGDPQAVGYPMSADEAGTAGGDGRYITLAGMHTIHHDDRDAPKPASHNIGMYRAQLIDGTHLAMHWHMHHDGASHWRSWKRAGEKRMPIAICLGGESVLPYAATAPLPPGISELLMAGFLNGKGIRLVRGKTVPLWVPANSEIVIEGWVSCECGFIGYDPRTGEALGPGAVFEGPFGDHTGFYSLPDRYPIVEVSAITHRREAVYPTTIVGLPPQEDYYLGKATERVFFPLLKTLIHDIEDYDLPRFGCFHNCAFIRIRKAYPLHARRVMHSVWGAGQMAWTKCIVVVDEDVNVHDERAVLRAMFEQVDFHRDVEVVNGPLDILDHAAPRLGAGHKIGFDATRKVAGEEVRGIAHDRQPVMRGDDVQALEESLKRELTGSLVSWVRVPEFGGGRAVFIGVAKQQAGDGERAVRAVWNAAEAMGEAAKGVAVFVIAVDATVNGDDAGAVLFHWLANSDPGRDLLTERAATTPPGPTSGRIGFDATAKQAGDERHGQPVRDWPPILTMDDATKALVDRRWTDYGFSA